MTADHLLKYEDVARLLTISKRGVEQLVHDGELIPVHPRRGSRLVRFRGSDIQSYIRGLPEVTNPR
ncbi:helix-turn-helix transcriptional regulator [Tsukamurella sp. USMM236]|uniref:helix-turn-helix transcriptional regulator n=1 Tax=Tsukamurella sp. USMM236 TaxID=3081301 RepID=UPI003017C694